MYKTDFDYDDKTVRLTFTEPPTTILYASTVALSEAKRHAVAVQFAFECKPGVAHPVDTVEEVIARFDTGESLTVSPKTQETWGRPSQVLEIEWDGKLTPVSYRACMIDGTAYVSLSDTFWGGHVSDAARKLLVIAKTLAASGHNVPAVFDFNGTDLIAERGGMQTVEEVVERWQEATRLSSEAYRKTPKAIAIQQERDSRNRADEAIIAKLYAELPGILDAIPDLPNLLHRVRISDLNLGKERLPSIRALLVWFAQYAPKADNINIDKKLDEIVALFEQHGFRSGDGLGRDRDAYKDPILLAVNIVGQTIQAAKTGMPPHPICGHWAETAIATIDALANNEGVGLMSIYNADYYPNGRTR